MTIQQTRVKAGHGAARKNSPARVARRVLASAWKAWFFIALVVVWWFVSQNSTSTFFPPLREIVATFYDLWIVGDASTTVVSPRPTSFMSGLTRCEAEICVKPMRCAISATRLSCVGKR